MTMGSGMNSEIELKKAAAWRSASRKLRELSLILILYPSSVTDGLANLPLFLRLGPLEVYLQFGMVASLMGRL